MHSADYVLEWINEIIYNYPIEALYFLNPMVGIVTAYRIALMSAVNPGVSFLALSFAVAWGIAGLGAVVFQRVQSRFGDEL